MPEWAATLIVVLVLLLVLFGMWQGWRAMVRRAAHLTPSHDVPAALGAPLAAAATFYVATTAHEKPLERLAIAGLGFRAHGGLAVYDAGLVLTVTGAEDVWIPASALIAVQPATVAIDKVVEKDGLLALSWNLGDTLVDSYFRVTEPEKIGSLYDAIESIAPNAPAESEV